MGELDFFYDKAKPLREEVEQHIPYYDLYIEWVKNKISSGVKKSELTYYLDYSIGFTTRGCFRQCEFCVNKNYKKVSRHSNISDFLDENRKYICLLDDNVLGCADCVSIFKELNTIGKRFQFKQGMDERLLTKEKCEMILNSNYIGDYIFAFDNIEDEKIIQDKLMLWNQCKTKLKKRGTTKFYVFCGFDRDDKYDMEFWKKDIEDTFERIKILMKYGCIPYIMRHKNYENSPFRGTYINLARWCNQPSFYLKKSYREFCQANKDRTKTKICSTMTYLQELEEVHPGIASKYFDIRFEELNKYK